MDIYRQAEALLRRAGYNTRLLLTNPGDVLCFEDDLIMGFLHSFGTAQKLMAQWPTEEKADLSRHTSQLRAAATKAWNVYCVFLTEELGSSELVQQIDRIEEDFTSTRKIARTGITSSVELERALLPLLPPQNVTAFSVADYESRLRGRLSFLPMPLAEAILRSEAPAEIARTTIEGS